MRGQAAAPGVSRCDGIDSRSSCVEALVLTVRAAAGSRLQNELELEFSPSDAVPVRESPEKI